MNLSATQIQLAKSRWPIGKAHKFAPSLPPDPSIPAAARRSFSAGVSTFTLIRTLCLPLD
jgi:hypothetical protein